MNGGTSISVPLADWKGTLSQFVQENSPFMPDYEMERIIKCLKEDGYATHKPVNSNEFVIFVDKEDKKAA